MSIKRKPGRPRSRAGFETVTLYVHGKSYSKFKDICDKEGVGYGAEISKLIQDEVQRRNPKVDVVCPICGKPCMNLNILEEHGKRDHREIGGKAVVVKWHEKRVQESLKRRKTSN